MWLSIHTYEKKQRGNLYGWGAITSKTTILKPRVDSKIGLETHITGSERRAQVRHSCSIFEHQEPGTQPQVNLRSCWAFCAVFFKHYDHCSETGGGEVGAYFSKATGQRELAQYGILPNKDGGERHRDHTWALGRPDRYYSTWTMPSPWFSPVAPLHQTQLDPRLIWASVHGSYCSNIERVGLTWTILFVPFCASLRLILWWPTNERELSSTNSIQPYVFWYTD